MGSRPEPRPMSKPVRALCALVTVVLVCSLGVVVTNHWNTDDTSATAASSDGDTDATVDDTTTEAADDGEWAGLQAAGIPLPGEWSKQSATAITWEDGEAVIDFETTVTINGSYGPIDTALATVNALIDPTGDDEEWAERVLSLLGADGGGVEHTLSDAPRWWWAQRTFDKDSVCSGMSDDNYLSASYDCSVDGEYEYEDTSAIKSNPYYYSDTAFPIPDDLELPSTVNPQTIVQRAYDTVLIPMDDGNWHVTVYCPASLYSPIVDSDGNEIDSGTLDDGDSAYTNVLLTGFGTADRPCVTVEVTVGGQKPFWVSS